MRRFLFRLRLILMIPIGVPAGLYYSLVGRRFPAQQRWLRLNIPRFIGRLFLALYGIHPRISGREHLSIGQARGVVVFANHTSRLDPYVLFALLPFPYKSFWSTKAHVTSESIGFARRYGEVFDLFFVHDKKDPRRTAKEFRRAADYVRSGHALSFFPEGQFSASGKPGDFGVACAKLALAAKAPIVPVAIAGTAPFFEERGRLRRGPVQVLVGPPIDTDDFGPRDAQALTRHVEAVVQAMHAGIGAAANPAPSTGARAESGNP